ncbi:hypothetical protein JG687_00014845 [Phytophthora cactorum]|uniref:Uncharacterized protein n=1 Tax=Phytophthora cactorum TaxID=29920 RepID=A0A8T1TWJ4_9STRA|nr:hypothetical protein JG687_00014845 [Phytophthora cactorum]
MVTDGCVVTYRCAAMQSIAKSHDGPKRTTSRIRCATRRRIPAAANGGACGSDIRGYRAEVTYQEIAGRRSQITERRTRSPIADR